MKEYVFAVVLKIESMNPLFATRYNKTVKLLSNSSSPEEIKISAIPSAASELLQQQQRQSIIFRVFVFVKAEANVAFIHSNIHWQQN